MKSVRSRLAREKILGSDHEAVNSPVGSWSRGFELDLRLREFEINQLTQRNNFFMIFQGVLIAGLVQSQGTAAPVVTFAMCALGVGVSLLQIGMAGGAKYWQSRWEAATRSSEIALILELVKKNRLAIHTFTHDMSLLSKEEREQVKKWNETQSKPENQITDAPELIRSIVLRDIEAGKDGLRSSLDWWVRRFAIAPQWSVSRIPIWTAGVLFAFWTIVLLHTIHLPWLEADSDLLESIVQIVPLKDEPNQSK